MLEMLFLYAQNPRLADDEASVKDIEDIVQEGKRSCVCPYYATRRAVKQSQASFLQAT